MHHLLPKKKKKKKASRINNVPKVKGTLSLLSERLETYYFLSRMWSVSVASPRLGLQLYGTVHDGITNCGQGTSELTISHKNTQDLTGMKQVFS